MNEEQLEHLLRKRGRALDGGVLGPQRADDLRRQLRDEARGEASRGSRLRIVRVAALVAAAVLAILLFGPFRPWRSDDSANHGELAIELALLDPLGRPVQRVERGTKPASFTPPDRVMLEIEAGDDGFATVALYDPLGVRRFSSDAPARPLAAGEVAFLDVSLADLPTRATGESVVGLCIVTSRSAIPFRELEAAFPEHIELDAAGEPGPALAGVAEEVSKALGCTVETRTLTLALR